MLEACLRSDALNVPSEEDVVTSLLRWIRHDLPGRKKLLQGLLSLTRLHHLPALKVETHCIGWILGLMGNFLVLISVLRRHPFSLRLCVIQTLSSATVSPVSLCSRRLRADRSSTAACSLTPGRPRHRATSTSRRRRRMGRFATPSATAWKRTSGKSWEQGTGRGPPCCQTLRDPT